jgi:hypothetical protein
MNFIRINLFLKLIKGFWKRTQSAVTGGTLERATWHADVSMTLPGGPGLLILAVGPADVSVDQSMLTGRRSPGQGSVGPAGQPHPEADRWVHRVRPGIREKEKGSARFWAKTGAGLAHGPSRLGLGFVVSSACGSAGRLGPRVSWLVLGLVAPWAAVGWRPPPFRLLLLTGWFASAPLPSR